MGCVATLLLKVLWPLSQPSYLDSDYKRCGFLLIYALLA